MPTHAEAHAAHMPLTKPCSLPGREQPPSTGRLTNVNNILSQEGSHCRSRPALEGKEDTGRGLESVRGTGVAQAQCCTPRALRGRSPKPESFRTQPTQPGYRNTGTYGHRGSEGQGHRGIEGQGQRGIEGQGRRGT